LVPPYVRSLATWPAAILFSLLSLSSPARRNLGRGRLFRPQRSTLNHQLSFCSPKSATRNSFSFLFPNSHFLIFFPLCTVKSFSYDNRFPSCHMSYQLASKACCQGISMAR